jgi:hypothetical protein
MKITAKHLPYYKPDAVFANMAKTVKFPDMKLSSNIKIS